MNRIICAFYNSCSGLKAAFQTEVAFRQELLLVLLLLPLALFLEIDVTSKALMVGSLFLILITELMNTAIEVLVDRISEKSHPLSKKAKDIGSTIVLLAFINWGFIWTLIVLKKVIY